jgi:Ca2+-binding RTX toxin-like protein
MARASGEGGAAIEDLSIVTTFSVNSTAALVSALSKAKSGDVVKVASGTYSNITIKNLQIAGNVTVTSADANKPAVFTDLLIRNSSGLTFQNLELAAGAKANNPFQVASSSNIVFDKLDVHGTLNGSPEDDGQLMMVRSSTNVTVSNSEFQQGMHALSFLDNDGLKIANNSFHDLRIDAVRGGGTSNLLITNNYFTDFYPQMGTKEVDGDHPDAIQLWTTNTKESAQNITITDNLIVRGNGLPVQGIFFRDQVGDLPFKNVTVTGNTVIGGIAAGIGLSGIDGLVVKNNEVVAIDGQVSHLMIAKTNDVTLSDNQASSFVVKDDSVTNISRSDNIMLDTLSVAGGKTLAATLAKVVSAKNYAGTADASVKAAVAALGYLDQPATAKIAQTFAQIQIAGTNGDDRLSAAKVGDSRVEGGKGNDVISGGTQGSHELVGGVGDDNYIIRSAADTVIEKANEGNDTVTAYIDYTLTANVETLRLSGDGLTGTGNELDNRIIGSAGADKIYGLGGDDSVQAGDGDDLVWGGIGNDVLKGEGGNDTLWGGDGNDTLSGGDGNDILYGDAGNDILEGGAGSDTLTGGAGNDIFRFRIGDVGGTAIDTITDFTKGQDKIDLSALDAKSATAANEAFSFIGTQSFHKVAGELRYEQVGGQTKIYGDVNGDGVADFTIVLTKAVALAAGDFAL